MAQDIFFTWFYHFIGLWLQKYKIISEFPREIKIFRNFANKTELLCKQT